MKKLKILNASQSKTETYFVFGKPQRFIEKFHSNIYYQHVIYFAVLSAFNPFFIGGSKTKGYDGYNYTRYITKTLNTTVIQDNLYYRAFTIFFKKQIFPPLTSFYVFFVSDIQGKIAWRIFNLNLGHFSCCCPRPKYSNSKSSTHNLNFCIFYSYFEKECKFTT